jgi:hypothetical protein
MYEAKHYMCCNEVEVLDQGQVVRLSIDDFTERHPQAHPSSRVHDNKDCVTKYYQFAAGGNEKLFNFLMDNYVSREGRCER